VGSGFISQAVAVSTTLRLRSFSRYLSRGWPETKKPRTSFSFWRRVCSSHSGAAGRASSSGAGVGGAGLVEHAEEAVLAGGGVALGLLGAFDGLVECGEDGGAGAKGVEGSCLAEGLEDALVHEAEIDFVAELPERCEAFSPPRLQFVSRGEDGVDGVVADVLDGREAEADLVAGGGEGGGGDLDVGGNDGDVDLATLADVLDDVLGLAGFGGEERGHELDWVVGFEPGGVVGEERVGGGVGFVEAVAGELGHLVEDFSGGRPWEICARRLRRGRSRAASPSRRHPSSPWRGGGGRRHRASSRR